MKLIYGMAGISSLIIAAAAIAVPSAAQSPTAGERAFVMCKACHTTEKGGRNGIGPNLSGLFGRAVGSVPDYTYSEALKKSGLRWDEKTLSEFLAAPTKKVPGTKMPIGVADPAKRAALIAYLKSATAK
ncbi:cytochrome c [Hephaestia caeni]|uniref:Cytochrome c n=1 Tax=Hephaestia caeni TaxID=645617 RepID=A0A397PE82_9SPHN|nr:cytochrome c family protein [Hephaestia caeni]RIA45525.1 cytochrome c [Hephaestia caeni]